MVPLLLLGDAAHAAPCPLARRCKTDATATYGVWRQWSYYTGYGEKRGTCDGTLELIVNTGGIFGSKQNRVVLILGASRDVLIEANSFSITGVGKWATDTDPQSGRRRLTLTMVVSAGLNSEPEI